MTLQFVAQKATFPGILRRCLSSFVDIASGLTGLDDHGPCRVGLDLGVPRQSSENGRKTIVQDVDGTLIPITPAVRSGGFIILSGQLALRDGEVVGQTIEEQTNVVIANIMTLLTPLGKGLADVVKVTTWLARTADFAGFNAALCTAFCSTLSCAVHGCVAIGDTWRSARNRSDRRR